MEPKVTLVSWTRDPIETICKVWKASREMTPLESIPKTPDEEARSLFKRILDMRVPVSEHLDFVFILENVSVSWREQAVRHRIGTHVGDRLGVDIVPDLADSSWWAQTMRVMRMDTFADEQRYRLPKSLEGREVLTDYEGKSTAEELYRRTMGRIQEAYILLIKAGVPVEDARELIPIGATHRISWKLNLAAIQHVIGKRSCWIAQSGLWHPVIMGMIDEMVMKVDPIFRDLAVPPCAGYKAEADDVEFRGCVVKEENRRRVAEDDPLPVCPLYLTYHTAYGNIMKLPPNAGVPMIQEMHRVADEYAKFWNRDPYTFGPLEIGKPVKKGGPL